jgi:hypothetical protein
MIKKIVANPFQAGGRLRDPRHFVGRESELRQILSRVANMDSVSVVGPRRIGKSSLLQHIVASGRERLNESYHFHYLDLQPLDSDEEFYNLACEAIAGKRGRSYDDLKTAIEGKKIVLCIDEFEKSVEADFGAEFFDEMRSLAQTGNLALVIATKASLNQIYLRYQGLTSGFPNIFTKVEIGELTEADARALVAKSDCFNPKGALLYDAKQEARDGAIDLNQIRLVFEDERNSATANGAATDDQPRRNATAERRAGGGSSGATIISLLLLLAGVLFGKLSVNSVDPTAGLLVSGGLILIGLALFLFRGVNWLGGTR